MVGGVITGIIIGILVTVITALIERNTPLLKSKVRVLVSEPPVLKVLEKKSTVKYTEILAEAKFLVKNYGFKSGHLEKILLAPNDLRITPRTKIVSFYRADISMFKTKWITVKYIIYIENDNKEDLGVTLEFYDEYGHYAGAIKSYLNVKTLK